MLKPTILLLLTALLFCSEDSDIAVNCSNPILLKMRMMLPPKCEMEFGGSNCGEKIDAGRYFRIPTTQLYEEPLMALNILSPLNDTRIAVYFQFEEMLTMVPSTLEYIHFDVITILKGRNIKEFWNINDIPKFQESLSRNMTLFISTSRIIRFRGICHR